MKRPLNLARARRSLLGTRAEQRALAGAPTQEHLRSRAALHVAQLAQRSHLFFAHYEHRAQLPLPRAWQSPGADTAPTRFVGGVLAEPKYQTFRHDLLVASFHPNHRAQWTAHELCHGLIGFAFKPGASTLFHALAAWLAELMPVALWYFFDEADLTRCRRHRGAGPLFQSYCEACERTALEGPRAPDRESQRRLRDGRRYVERELAAIARSRRLGRAEGTRFATIDLAEDALQYAAAHGARLRAPEMERFCAQFFAKRQGLHASLDALEARVVELCGALSGDGRAAPWRASRWDWAAQDVGYRLLSLRAAQPGQARALDALIDRLAAARTERGLSACIRGYELLYAEAQRGRARSGLPSPERLFAVGYALPGGHGSDQAQLRAGVLSACPSSLRALGKDSAAMLRAFSAGDAAERAPIGRRFARFLAATRPGPCAELCALEAAITHAPVRPAWVDSLDPFEGRSDGVVLAPGVQIVHVEHDVVGSSPGRIARARRLAEPRALLVLRRAGQPVDVLELPVALAERLAAHEGSLPKELFEHDSALREELLSAGVLVPTAYAE